MTQPRRITPAQPIQLESLLSLAMLTPAQFEQLIGRLSNQGVLDDIVVMNEHTDEKTPEPLPKSRRVR